MHVYERCTVPRRDPNSSWLDLDGWFDDFMVADHHNLSEQTALLTSTLASIDWNSVLTSFGVIDEPLSPEYARHALTAACMDCMYSKPYLR